MNHCQLGIHVCHGGGQYAYPVQVEYSTAVFFKTELKPSERADLPSFLQNCVLDCVAASNTYVERSLRTNLLLTFFDLVSMNSTGLNAHDLFEILVRENSRMLMAYVRSVTRNAAAADDAWQETMMIAWRRIEDFDRSRPFGPWLRGIASRVMLAQFRKDTDAVSVDEATLEYLDSRFETVQALRGDTLDEKLQALRDCVAALPEHYRTCIELRFMTGLKPKQLSERIGVALESVKKRLVRAKGLLLNCIEQKIATEQT